MTMYEPFFICDQKYKQSDFVAMGSPLGPTLVNVFMCHFENIWLENCPTEFKPVVYRRYVGDTFLLFYIFTFLKSISTRNTKIFPLHVK